MIFICVGSREYQFDRLLKKIDEIALKDLTADNYFAQIGQSNYEPRNFKFARYLDSDVFRKYQEDAEIIISHGGTGALIGALKLGKQVIAVPRLQKYGEHIDDHQLQISGALAEQGYLKCLINMEDLEQFILELKIKPISKRFVNESKIIEIINHYIDNELNNKKRDKKK